MDQPAFEPRRTSPQGELVGRIAMHIIGLMFLCVCVLLVIHTATQCWRAHRARSWPTTEAKIGFSFSYHMPLSLFHATVDLTYFYNVDDQSPRLESKRLCYGRYRYWNIDRRRMNTNNPYPSGTTMPVHYNPDDSSESVLLTDVNVISTLHPVLFTMCLGLAGLFLKPKWPLKELALGWLRSWSWVGRH